MGDTKERIMEVAVRLFAKKGYSATGVREIAREARVNLAMISYYFGSKRGILEAILELFFRRYREVVQGALKSGAPQEKLRMFIRSVILFFRENPEFVRIAVTEIPYDVPEIAQFKAERVKGIVDLLRKGFLGEGVSPIKPEVIGPALLGTLISPFLLRSVMEEVFNISFDDSFYKRYAEQITEIFLYGAASKFPPQSKKEKG